MNGFRYDINPNSFESTLSAASHFDAEVHIPDMHQMKHDRLVRNQSFLQKVDTLVGGNRSSRENMSVEDVAATKIQTVFRGFIARKKYLDILFEAVSLSEKALAQRQQIQVHDGELLIENYKLECELDNINAIDRNKSRLLCANAIVIQRVWREKQRHKNKKEHICCPCNDECPDLYDYYNKNNAICFCCENHRINGFNDDSVFLCDNDLVNNNHSENNEVSNDSDMCCISKDITGKYVFDENGNITNFLEPKDLNKADDLRIDFPSNCCNHHQNSNNSIKKTDCNSDIIAATKAADMQSTDNLHSLPLVEESRRILNSLKIHEKLDNERGRKLSDNCYRELTNLESMSTEELRELIAKFNSDIACKNVELLEELMLRDELHTCHEALLMDADDLTNGQKNEFV